MGAMMRVAWIGAVVAAATTASMALAGAVPRYEPTPAWIKPAPAIDSVKAAATPGALLVVDQQQRLQAGEVWSYVDTATRILSEQALAQGGTITLTWQPDLGDLIVHRIVIIRGDRQIDIVAGAQPLTVLRRELGLETLALDGILTATMPVPGLQVGDILRVSYSTTRKDPLLGGHMQSTGFLITEPQHVGFGRLRVLWHDTDAVRWQALSSVSGTPLPVPGGMQELSVTLPLPKPKEMPGDAPPRFFPVPLLEVSSFTDWASVSATMAPLYNTAGLAKPGGPLAKEIARIKAASSDPKTQAAAALRTVQGDVRYLFNGLDKGNYRPQPPELTWEVRFGDCKAKTLLLLTLLHGLGIEAEPALTHIQLSDFLPKRLPSAMAFNHILVRATIDGKSYWLDGTGAGARLEDIGDTPPLRYVLPLRAAGASLMPIPFHANARANFAVDLDVDLTAGPLTPSPFTVSLTVVGGIGEALRTASTNLTGDKRKEELDKILSNFLPDTLIASREISYDAASGSATLRGTGLLIAGWQRPARRYEQWPKTVIGSINLDGVRGRPEWRQLPVVTRGVSSLVMHTRLQLPEGGKGFELDNDKMLPASLAGRPVQRTVVLKGDIVTLDERLDEIGNEIAPPDIAAAKAAMALAKSRPLKVVAPADYKLHWQVIRASRAAGRLKPIEAAYAKTIDDATEKAPAYTRRAEYWASVYDYTAAIADLGRAITERSETSAYRSRANLLWATSQDASAIADLKIAYDLDPSATSTITALSLLQAQHGERDIALARLDEQIEAGGDEKRTMQLAKAEVLANDGQLDGALALIDAAIKEKPGTGALLNARCWLRASHNIQLQPALADCNRAIEIGDEDATGPLTSRAMVYYRLGRVDEALADLDATVAIDPENNAAHFLRGIIRTRRGDKVGAEIDLIQARTADPRMESDYKKFGIGV